MTEHETPIPAMGLRRAVTIALLVVVAELAVSAWGWATIPAGTLLPTHWGLDGRADGWTPKEPALLMMPALTLLLALLLGVLPRFEPRRSNLARSAGAYRVVVVGIVALLGALHVVVVLAGAGVAIEIDRAVTLGMGILFALIGNVLGKVRSNFMFGIRTPWTLASDRSWDRTHRLMGRIWVAGGLVLALLALAGAPGPVLFGWLAVSILASTVGGVVYSYRVWRSDPDRVPADPFANR